MNIKKLTIWDIVIYAILFLGCIVMIYPFLWMISSSFKTASEIVAINNTFLPKSFFLGNYSFVWNQFKMSTYFTNSVFISLVQTTIALYTSAIAGYVFDKLKFRGRDIIFYCVIATMMIPWPVTLIPMYQQMVWFKWVGTYSALIVPRVFNTFGVFMMRQFMRSIPTSLIEAARLDGAGEFSLFHRIVLPNLKAALSALAIFVFLWSWDDFLWPFLMIEKKSMYTLPIGLALFKGEFYTNYGATLAGATIAVVPVVIVYLIFQSSFVKGIVLSGINE